MDKRIRWMLAVTLGVSLAGAGPGPTTQGKPGGSSGSGSATFAVAGTCTFTVTYTWSGFKGKNLTASFGLWHRTGTNLDASVSLTHVTGQAGSSGTASHTFTLRENAVAARTLYGRGSLFDAKNQQVTGSVAGSSTTTSSTCG